MSFLFQNSQFYSGAIDGFNMAQAGTKTFNLSSQAKKLVSEMQGNPNVDFKHDWKMVTVLVGKTKRSKGKSPVVLFHRIASPYSYFDWSE